MLTNDKHPYSALCKAMLDDGLEPGSYSHVWFRNIKMPIYDGIVATMPGKISKQVRQEVDNLSAKIANQLMKNLFDITTNYE